MEIILSRVKNVFLLSNLSYILYTFLFTPMAEEQAKKEKNEERGRHLYKTSIKILKHSKRKKEKNE